MAWQLTGDNNAARINSNGRGESCTHWPGTARPPAAVVVERQNHGAGNLHWYSL